LTDRCLLLFTRSPREEERAKRIPRAHLLFAWARRRIARIARSAGVPLLVTGSQRGDTFGERLIHAVEEARSRGYRQVVIVPTDVPQLAARDVTRAFALLEHHDLVVGPSYDGGVYLIAIGGDATAAFASVRWLTPHVLEDLAGAVRLRPLADVDRHEDLVTIRRSARGELARILDGLLLTNRFVFLFTPPVAAHVAPALRPRAPPRSAALSV
jgi:glycosyltransferase A (GT-A) superfamily protein (DUF2064 family)